MSRIDGLDVLIIAGMIFIGYGLYLIDDPIIIMVTGGVLMAIGMVGAWIKGHKT
jgi:hypothetical protein